MKKSRVCSTFIVVLLILMNSVFVSAITGSIGNARMILSETLNPELGELDGKTTVTIEKSILVRNVNDIPVNVTLKVDPDGGEFIEIIDDNFILEAADNGVTEKKARFNVNIKDEGSYEGKINVFFAPVNSDEPGVVLSSTIIVNANPGEDYTDDGDNSEDNTPIAGWATNEGLNKGAIALGISTLILIVLLGVLVYVQQKKASARELLIQDAAKKEAKINVKKNKEKQ